ncbi:hypothetical protein CCHL11_09932 [Colletotrichum chlorophyti]|uniref:Uncharacterized protein n=1 Tax=Colletotrichum chlorophyti TaxID=708187 RepID=A0A1Q8RNU3_9PEZI|nr:hypothetical protein CCHL11_09932 [Colletotrichum chlorophyti]
MLAHTVLLAMLSALALAQKFEGFPTTLTCQQSDGDNDNITDAELQTVVIGPKGNLYDKSAANIGAGKCSSLSGIPLYTTRIEGTSSLIWFAYDKVQDTYHFCFGTGALHPKIGYPTRCEEI